MHQVYSWLKARLPGSPASFDSGELEMASWKFSTGNGHRGELIIKAHVHRSNPSPQPVSSSWTSPSPMSSTCILQQDGIYSLCMLLYDSIKSIRSGPLSKCAWTAWGGQSSSRFLQDSRCLRCSLCSPGKRQAKRPNHQHAAILCEI